MADLSIQVLVVDDHPLVRSGLISEINLHPEVSVAGEAKNGLEAIKLAEELQPDVILMDIIMPRMDGIQATREILAGNPQAKILMLTSFTEEDRMLAAIDSGASGIIFKDQHPKNVLKAIKQIHAGQPVLPPEIIKNLMRARRSQSDAEPKRDLTERELDVLRLVATGKPYKMIAHELGLRQTTVRVHVSNILSKLNLSNRSQLVLYAVQEKIIDPESAQVDRP